MKISFYQAACGNAARMEYEGLDGQVHNIFVDAGYERTFDYVLAKEIQQIQKAGQVIDAWIISHIHDDHIGGVEAYLKTIKSNELVDKVDKWIYNPPRGTSSVKADRKQKISEAKSIAQGDKVASYLASIDKLPDNDITCFDPTINLFGLQVTFLSPDQDALSALRKKYPPNKTNPFERNEDTSISRTKSATGTDYHIPVEAFRSIQPRTDRSIENRSSISFLAEYNGKRILWLADAWPSIICSSLETLGFSCENPLECEWVVVAHHGSSGNNTKELYSLLRCNNYLISADGNSNAKLPTKACLANILLSPVRNAEKCKLYFTYDNEILRSIFKVDGPRVYKQLNFEVIYNNQPIYSSHL